MTLVSSEAEDSGSIVANLLDLWIKRSKDELFVLENKSFLLSLAINDSVKRCLFQIYYKILTTREQVDKSIYNIICLWNLEMNLVDHSEFLNGVLEKNVDLLTYPTELSVCKKETPGSLTLLQRIQSGKIKMFAESSKDGKANFLHE